MLVILRMFGSNSPSVEGRVSMKTQVRSSTSPLRASTSTLPSESDGTVTTSSPAIAADAGLVPWALSGMSATVLALSPRSSK